MRDCAPSCTSYVTNVSFAVIFFAPDGHEIERVVRDGACAVPLREPGMYLVRIHNRSPELEARLVTVADDGAVEAASSSRTAVNGQITDAIT